MRLTHILGGFAAAFLLAGIAVLAAPRLGWWPPEGTATAASGTLPALVMAPVAAAPPGARPAAPPFRFHDEAGRNLTLADFHGRTVLVNVWATWCAPCVAEMPDLDALQAQMGGGGFQVVAISIDEAGIAAVRRFFAARGIRHIVPYAARSSDIATANLPASWLIDGDGKVAWRGLGARPWTSAAVEAVLRSLAPAAGKT